MKNCEGLLPLQSCYGIRTAICAKSSANFQRWQLLVNKNVKKANDGDEDHCNKYKGWQSVLLAIACTSHIGRSFALRLFHGRKRELQTGSALGSQLSATEGSATLACSSYRLEGRRTGWKVPTNATHLGCSEPFGNAAETILVTANA